MAENPPEAEHDGDPQNTGTSLQQAPPERFVPADVCCWPTCAPLAGACGGAGRGPQLTSSLPPNRGAKFHNLNQVDSNTPSPYGCIKALEIQDYEKTHLFHFRSNSSACFGIPMHDAVLVAGTIPMAVPRHQNGRCRRHLLRQNVQRSVSLARKFERQRGRGLVQGTGGTH